ncbi:TruD family tRNA pseudouridine synthase, partial [Vavraia culicis subsp. floridensis]
MSITNSEYIKTRRKAPFSFVLRKENEDTVEACMRISKELNVPFKNVKFAGNKDRRAITYQRVSINDVYYDNIKHLHCVRRERGYLKLGGFKGNRFTIMVRPKENSSETGDCSLDDAVMNMDLNMKMVPNFFGPQRFGRNLNNHLVGKLIQEKKYEDAVNLIMMAEKNDGDYVKEAKQSFHNKEYDKAYAQFPKNCLAEKSICRNITRGYKYAVFSIKEKIRVFYLHAYQSYVFNQELSKLLGGKYEVNEELVLKGSKVKRKAFTEIRELACKKKGNDYQFTFTLGPSSYATIVLRELLGE